MRWSTQSVSMGWLRTAAGAEQTCSARGETRLMPLFVRRLAAGHDVRLLCWCKPARCHCDALAVLLRERVVAMRCAGKRRR